MTLAVTVNGQTATVEPDTAALSWAERCSGLSYEAMGEASLQLAVAYYYAQHNTQPEAVDWDVIHTWGSTNKVITASQ